LAIEALYLFDVNEHFMDLIPGEDLLEHGQTQELKKLITISASALYSEMLESAVFVGHRDIDDSNVFHQYRVTKFKNNNGIAEIEGVHAFFDDMQAYGFIKDKRPTDATVSTALGGILEGSRWQLGVIQSAHSATSNYYYVSRLEAFWDFIEKWNVEFKLRMVYSDGVIIARYIDIYDQLSADYGKWYEYGDQLLTVEKEEDRQGVYTALIGRGKGEETEAGGFGRRILFSDVEWTIAGGDPVDKPLLQDYVELPSATAQYGYSDGTPRIGIVEFEDITDPTLLLEATYQTLLNNCRPQVQFKAGVDEKGVSELGEIVTIIRDDLNIRYKTRIYKLRRNFLDVMDKEFTFGDKLTTTQGERSVQINKDIKKQEQQTISWLEAVNASMMSMFWNEDGYNYTFAADNEYGLPGGFYSFNAPIDMDPTKCIYMGAGMLAIANSKLPDGSWNFRTWGTGDGFTADLITTGTLRAELIRVGWNNINSQVGIDADGLWVENDNGEKTYMRKGGLSFVNKYAEDTGFIGMGYNTSDNTINGMLIGADYQKQMTFGRKATAETGSYTPFMRLEELYDLLNFYVPIELNNYLEMNSNTIWNVGEIYGGGKIRLTTNNSGTQGSVIFNGSNQMLVLGSVAGASLGVLNGDGVTTTGRLDIHTTQTVSHQNLNMNGNMVINQSDIRLKKNVVDASVDPISVIEKMRFIEFEWDETNPYNAKKPNGRYFGTEAQYSPFLAVKDVNSNYLSIDMGKQVNLNSMALQRMISEIKTLKEENAETKKELADLKQLLTEKGVI
jgi:phage minor structural protein